MRELFIYYRLRSIDAAAAQAVVLTCQDQLRAHCPPLIARLLRRPEETDGYQTWMETYTTDPLREPAGISPELQAEIERGAQALAPWLVGSRHTEVFITCAS